MIEVVEQPQTGHFHLVDRNGEALAIAATRDAADDLADLLLDAWNEALAAAVALARMKHGPAIIKLR